MWRTKSLSNIGKVVIWNSLIMSKFYYKLFVDVPSKFLYDSIKKLQYNFFGNNMSQNRRLNHLKRSKIPRGEGLLTNHEIFLR